MRDYMEKREREIAPANDGKEDETLVWYGTGATTDPTDLMEEPNGIDPRLLGEFGIFGHAVYTANNPAYLVAGHHAHRVRSSPESDDVVPKLPNGSRPDRMQLVLMRLARGAVQDLGTRVDSGTARMQCPGIRPRTNDEPKEGQTQRRARYSCVRGGPHEPALNSLQVAASGSVNGSAYVPGVGDSSSLVYACYDAAMLYPAYIVTFDLPPEEGWDASFVRPLSPPGTTTTTAALQRTRLLAIKPKMRGRVNWSQRIALSDYDRVSVGMHGHIEGLDLAQIGFTGKLSELVSRAFLSHSSLWRGSSSTGINTLTGSLLIHDPISYS